MKVLEMEKIQEMLEEMFIDICKVAEKETDNEIDYLERVKEELNDVNLLKDYLLDLAEEEYKMNHERSDEAYENI